MVVYMALRLNPNLDPAIFAAIFERDGVVQIPAFLEPDDAEAVAAMMNALTWNVVAPDETSETLVISPQAIAKFGEAQVRQFLQGALKRASRGFSFIHLSYALQDEYRRDPTSPIHRATELLQSRTFLDFGAAVIGREPVDGVRVQASNYRPGDFLTLHDDRHKKDDRLAAFTLGFTRGWRPDWGGQLLFHDADGQIERGLMPGFNVLTLFRVPRAHSVAPVAAYAAAKRLSLTGWLVREPG
ncbi:MAG: 2OG-Fe(II) oxygenase [Alphaproteobacteria bacterium]|nr:2OG-Fe(II) oxygenase [Alphaproteobacteria bacterium]